MTGHTRDSNRRRTTRRFRTEELETRRLLAGDGIPDPGELDDGVVEDVGDAVPDAPTDVGPIDFSFSSFAELAPRGSLAFESEFSGEISSAEGKEDMDVVVQAGQTLSVLFHASESLRGRVVLRDPSNTIVAQQNATTDGESLLIQSYEVGSNSGTYTIRLTSISSTTGSFDGIVLINGAIEEEDVTGANNNAPANPQNVDASFISIGGGVERSFVRAFRDADLEDGFEAGFLNDAWTTHTSQPGGRVRVTNQFPAAEGSNFLLLDRSGISPNNLSEATWTVDLSAVSTATLNFSHISFGDEITQLNPSFTGSFDGDGVSVSEDEITWYTILNAPNTPEKQWQTFSIDLVQFAADKGINLDADFHIKFQQFDNGPFPLDGRGFDGINIDTTPALSQEDWYQFALGAGENISAIVSDLNTLTGLVIPTVTIYDSNLTSLASSQGLENASQIISDFRAQKADDYLIQLLGPPDDYGLLLTKETSFDFEANSSLTDAQEISATNSALGFVSDAAGTSLNLLSSFDGPSYNGLIPPDPTLAVGPSEVVVSVNSEIAIYDKSTGQVLFTQEFGGENGFFDDVGSVATAFDPWLLYDTDTERFFLVAIDTESSTVANLYLAVSTDSTPTGEGDWHKYIFNYIHDPLPLGLGSGLHFADYEKIGVNDDAIFVSGNYFPISNGTGVYAGITAFNKDALINGDPIEILYQEFMPGFSVFPLQQYESGSTQYFVESDGTETIRLHAVTNVLTNPVREVFDLTVPEIAAPINVPQLGGSVDAEGIDSRVMTGVWRNGSAWFAHAIVDPNQSEGETVARWYEVATNDFPANDPILIQSGNVEPGPGVYTFMPGISVDANNNMAIGFSTGGPNQYLGAAFTGRFATDPLGSTASPYIEYAPGLGPYQRLGGSRNRWGDYTGLSIDPSDNATFWAFNEYASFNNTWETRVASFQVDPKPDSDVYEFQVSAQDDLVIETFTPFDVGVGDASNAPDVEIQLYGPGGALIASDLNSAGDGRNARIELNNATNGVYKVRVRPTFGTGTYRLDISGSSGENPRPEIIASTPSDSLQLNSFPETYTVFLTEQIEHTSVEVSDFTITGPDSSTRNAIGFEIHGNEITFTIDPLSNVGDGVYSITMPLGSVRDYQGKALGTEFTAEFSVDTQGITILSTTWNGELLPSNRKVEPGTLTFEALLSETPFRLASARRGLFAPGTDDILLSDVELGHNIDESSIDVDRVSNTFTATYNDLPESNYRLRLISGPGAFEDESGNILDGDFNSGSPDGTPTGDGNPGSDYVVSFSLDITNVAAKPFERLEPFGSAYSRSLENTGFLNGSTDTDDFRFYAHAGEVISAVANVDNQITATLEIVDVGSVASNAHPGESVNLTPQRIPEDGFYRLRIGGDAKSNYSIDIVRNAIVESFISDDSSLDNPIRMDDTFIPLGSGRYGVIGNILSDVEFVKFNDPENSLFIDIRDVGVPLDLADDGEITVTSELRNSAFDATTMTIANNGALAEGANINIFFQNLFVPAPDIPTALFPFWDDLSVSLDNVYVDQRTIDDVPSIIVQWEQMPHFDAGGAITFEAQIIESGPVLARFVYPDVIFGDPAVDGAGNATIGYQNVDGRAIEYSLNTPVLVDGDVLELRSVHEDDAYTIDLSSMLGHSIDVVVKSFKSSFVGSTLELIDPNGAVVATGISDPTGVNATNFDLGILDHVVADIGNNIYTIRLNTNVNGEYGLLVTDDQAYEVEPNDRTSDSLRTLVGNSMVGYLNEDDTDDIVAIELNAGETVFLTTATPLDDSAGNPVNSLDPKLTLIDIDGTTILRTRTDSLDGKNASVEFTVTQTGTYFVNVGRQSGEGEFVLNRIVQNNDFGDAPASYNTLLANNGARHQAIGPKLGSFRDAEVDGVPTGNADGDDLAGQPDDEDGISVEPYAPGQQNAQFTARVQDAPSGALLSAWIDFDGNGRWTPAEQVADDLPVSNGANFITFDVPANAAEGSTYARFRLSTDVGLVVTGPASDGEVEDYPIEISSAPAVASVRIASSRWQQAFTNFVDPSLGLGYKIPFGSGQLDTLPWMNMNLLYIQFLEDVVVEPSDIGLFGVNVRDYGPLIDSITYDSTNFIATIELKPGEVFEADKLLLQVKDTVVDRSNNSINEFLFRFNVVPGDTDRNTLVASGDVVITRQDRLQFIGTENYNIRSDLDGTSLINSGDMSLARSRRATFLPPGTPSPPANALAAKMGAAIDKVFDEKEKFEAADWELDDIWLPRLESENLRPEIVS